MSNSHSNSHSVRDSLKNGSLQLFGGGISGLIVAFSLNPWDKALYISVTEHRHFLDIRNFKHPFQGVTQSLFQKTISHGLYFPLEQWFVQFSKTNLSNLNTNSSDLTSQENKQFHNFVGGTLAGVVNALIMNPISALKYTRWQQGQSLKLRQDLSQMYFGGGISQFSKGMYATVMRDSVFGAIFATMRHGLRNKHIKNNTLNSENGNESEITRKIGIDMFSAFVATTASGPFNYVRNIQYATPKEESNIVSMYSCLKELWIDGIKHSNGDKLKQVQYYLWRLRVGWGTARVAVGMAFTSFAYEFSLKYFNVENS